MSQKNPKPSGPCFKCGKIVKWRFFQRFGNKRYVYWCFDHKPIGEVKSGDL